MLVGELNTDLALRPNTRPARYDCHQIDLATQTNAPVADGIALSTEHRRGSCRPPSNGGCVVLGLYRIGVQRASLRPDTRCTRTCLHLPTR